MASARPPHSHLYRQPGDCPGHWVPTSQQLDGRTVYACNGCGERYLPPTTRKDTP